MRFPPAVHFDGLELPRRPAAAYQLGLALVAITMLVLPVIYIALTASVCYGVYYFATHHFLAIWDWPVGNFKYGLLLKLLCSVTPLVVGFFSALFMIKPLFAGRASRMQPLALDPDVEPRIYELVRGICQAVAAPEPRRIEVNCELNASAGFARGLRSFFGSDLVLTLGMPLVAGLTQRELAGVVAHEFGHFRQGAAMRLTYLIRSVNGWFARVVYERDQWDETIESWSESEEGWLAFMIGCVRFGIWLSRRILWLLMMFGHMVSALLMRQMEYDADRVETAVAGSAAFESTMLKLASLGSVMSEIHREMRRSWRNHFQLPDNLPVLVEYRALRLSPEKREKLHHTACLEKTGLLDTHPSSADRIRRARQLGAAGLDISEAPAKELFDNFDTVSRLVTLAHYEDDLSVPTTPDFLIPLEQLIRAEDTPAPARSPHGPVPMMAYDPSAFRGKAEATEVKTGE